MRVLVVNAGSTSLKLALVDGGAGAEPIRDLAGAAGAGVDAVGHRIVHGGERHATAVIDAAVERDVRAAVPIAPLHNAPALRGLEEARAALPGVPHVAVFDTAFHATLPEVAATYAVPREWGIRRHGFHGLSVRWAASVVRAPRLVVCHLGGGCSVSAVLDGRSVDTTMGFTPLDGVPMGTRSGAVDPGALLHRLRSGTGVEELADGLERRAGLVGLAGTARVDELEARDDAAARLALDVLAYRVAGAVASMSVALGGLDALVFTAGIGERSAGVRARVCERLGFLGIDLDAARNAAATGGDADVHAEGSAVRVAVVEAREDRVIAQEVEALLGG